jgi:DNA-directed RNA polymerase specialized sigma24 family protein
MDTPVSRAQEVRDLTEDELWDLYTRLRYFTYKHYWWLQVKIVGGIDLDALIHDSILDVMTGVRSSPPEVPLFMLLCQTIRSKASHLWEKEKRRLSIADWQEANPPAPLEYLLRNLSAEHPYLRPAEPSDQQTIYNQLCNRIRELVRGDDLLTRIVDLWFVTPDLKPREIAEALNIPNSELRKAQKRLSRKVKTLREAWSNEQG